MNDDLEAAETHLNKGTSPFHQVRHPCGQPAMSCRIELGSSQKTAGKWSLHVHEGNPRF
jgi:hypothetical protein